MAANQFGQEDDEYDYDEDEEDGEEDDWRLSSSPSPSASPPPPSLPPSAPLSAPNYPSSSFMAAYQSFQQPTPPSQDVRLSTSRPFLLTSPRCSMDDDSTSDSDGEVASQPGSRMQARNVPVRQPQKSVCHAQTPSSFANSGHDSDSVTGFSQRRAMIKELESKYQQECFARCRSLLVLQRRWRQEIE